MAQHVTPCTILCQRQPTCALSSSVSACPAGLSANFVTSAAAAGSSRLHQSCITRTMRLHRFTMSFRTSAVPVMSSQRRLTRHICDYHTNNQFVQNFQPLASVYRLYLAESTEPQLRHGQ